LKAVKQFFLLAIALLFGYHLSAQKISTQQKVDKEDFLIFLQNFSEVQEFQRDRLMKKSLDCEVTENGDSTCHEIDKAKWKKVSLLSGGELRLIYDNYSLSLRDNDERVFSIEGVETGAGTFYFFKRVGGKWYLLKRLVYL
jgi:hypothetical protein